MSLTSIALQVISRITARLPPPENGLRRAISFGYPDIMVSEDALFELFGNDVSRQLRFRDDSEAIIKWHGASSIADRIVESQHFFSLIGYDLTIADIAKIRGDELLVDLNHPLDGALKAHPFDLVIDGGTAEHCFNIGQALKNMAELVRVGGCIVHLNPAAVYNHGFYNLNPTLYADFYGHNGFRIVYLKAVANAMLAPTEVEVPAYKRFPKLPQDALILCAAFRERAGDIGWPMQAKYRTNPTQTA